MTSSSNLRRASKIYVSCGICYPPPFSSKNLLEFVQISRPTLAEVGWERAHPCLPVATPVQSGKLYLQTVGVLTRQHCEVNKEMSQNRRPTMMVKNNDDDCCRRK